MDKKWAFERALIFFKICNGKFKLVRGGEPDDLRSAHLAGRREDRVALLDIAARVTGLDEARHALVVAEGSPGELQQRRELRLRQFTWLEPREELQLSRGGLGQSEERVRVGRKREVAVGLKWERLVAWKPKTTETSILENRYYKGRIKTKSNVISKE